MNIADILAEHARARPDHPAIEDGERVVSYAELEAQVSESAANLQAAGIAAGDIVAVMLPDSADHLIVLYALARAGAPAFSLSPTLPRGELEVSFASLPLEAVIAHGQAPEFGPLRRLDIDDIRGPAATPFAAVDTEDDQPLLLIQSSGTTGEPKSFVRSHGQMREWIQRYVENYGWSPADRYLSFIHMYFNVGRSVCLGMLHVGATVVFDDVRSLDGLVAAVRDRGITFLKLAPTHLRQLLGGVAGGTPLFPDVRVLSVGSAPFTQDERSLARRRLTPNLHEQLGTNETGVLAIATPADQDAYPDAVGRLLEGIEAEIVDADDNPLPAGEVGVVRFRGPGFATGYLDNPEATARAFRDGWFYPGDLAALNDEGYLFFKGRADDMITSGGVLFYPVEVENALLAHPAVTEAAAFPWPHKREGELVAAAVSTNAKVAGRELMAFCAERIAGYKVPRFIMFVEKMPKNAMGKILKSKLKDRLRQELVKRP